MSRFHDDEAPRRVGAISSDRTRQKGFIFATDAQQQEYFVHYSMCRPQQLFDELTIGDVVSFAVASAPKGLRGHDVRRATPEEQQQYRVEVAAHTVEVADRRGNASAYGERQTFAEEDSDDGRRRRRRS